MSSVQSSAGSELQYIYAILRKLRAIGAAESNQGTKINSIGLEETLFSRKFLFCIIEERLTALDTFAGELVSKLFKRLNKRTKQTSEDAEIASVKSDTLKSKCYELDEFFHYCLYYLHDFFIELDWHETSIEDLSTTDASYVSSCLPYVNNFLAFQKTITSFVERLKTLNKEATIKSTSNVSKIVGSSGIKSLKSSLSVIRSASPRRRRRVRFKSSSSPDKSESSEVPDQSANKELQESQLVFALDLLIYALNLFIQQLGNNLAEWSSNTNDLKDFIISIKESKQKIRTAQLNSVSRQIKIFNDVYLTVLENLYDLRKTYMIEYTLGVVCANNPDRSNRYQRRPRIGIFVQKVEFDVEQKILMRLAYQCLQVLIDLINNEVNLPPVELETSSKTKSKEEIVKSRENYLNFISSWLNVDDVVFGFISPKKRLPASNTNSKDVPKETVLSKESTLASGRFKSSSRILAQMDNLDELTRDFLDQILDRIRSDQQLKYFLELIHLGIDESFDIMSKQVYSQLVSSRQQRVSLVEAELNDMEVLSKSVDLITAKIRCLKLIHITSSIDKQIKETAVKRKVDLSDRSLESKLNSFTDQCAQQNLPLT